MIIHNEICQGLQHNNTIDFTATKTEQFHQKIMTILLNELKDLVDEGDSKTVG